MIHCHSRHCNQQPQPRMKKIEGKFWRLIRLRVRGMKSSDQRIDYFPLSKLREAADAAHTRVVGINLHHFGPGHGVTGIVVLAESHISIHTWPETGLVAVDIFVCGKHADAHAALDVIAMRFRGTVAFVQAIPRLGARVS